MAYLYQRKGGRTEIREAHSTARGPRSHTLVSFRGALLPEHLDRAEATARRRFDRAAIQRRARELGVAVAEPRADEAARELLGRLRRGARLDPRLAALLRDRLAALPGDRVPEELADVADWVGATDVERGRALRDVLRLYDAIARSREPVRAAPAPSFPRFTSRPARAAAR
jgi:hypothetical protein